MNIKLLGILMALIIGMFILPIVIAQQPNEYRAYVYGQIVRSDVASDGRNVTVAYNIGFIPVYPSRTYTFTVGSGTALVDMTQPTKINDQIAEAVKQEGLTRGYDVLRVYVPSYDMKIP